MAVGGGVSSFFLQNYIVFVFKSSRAVACYVISYRYKTLNLFLNVWYYSFLLL